MVSTSPTRMKWQGLVSVIPPQSPSQMVSIYGWSIGHMEREEVTVVERGARA